MFHVVLAQNQLQLDRLNAQITKEQRTYEQRRLTASLLASPQRIIQEAERLGLVVPARPAAVPLRRQRADARQRRRLDRRHHLDVVEDEAEPWPPAAVT